MAEEDLKTVNKNLAVLRQRYLKLADEHQTLQKKFESLLNSTGGTPSVPFALSRRDSGDSLPSPLSPSPSQLGLNGGSSASDLYARGFQSRFQSDLITGVQNLSSNPRYSDLTLVFPDGQRIRTHKNILSWRSRLFAELDLTDVREYQMGEEQPRYEIMLGLIRFVYTDSVELGNDDMFLLDLMIAASEHGLPKLVSMCEMKLTALVSLQNATLLFKHADHLKTMTLRSTALDIILNEFDNLKQEDLDSLDHNLLAEIYREKSDFPLHMAIEHGRDDVVFIFLLSDLQNKINQLNDRGKTPLRSALDSKHYRIASALLETGCNIDATNSTESSTLQQVILNDDVESVKFLIQNKANVNHVNQNRDTSLHLAVGRRNLEIAKALLEAGSPVNSQNKLGETPLHLATKNADRNLLELLIGTPSINLNLLDKEYCTPFWLALKSHNEEIATILFDQGCDLTILDAEGNTLLHRAIDGRDLFSSKFIVSKKVNLNIQNKRKQSPLHRASLAGLDEIVKILLESEDIDPNSKDDQGQTPIHLAIRSKNPRILELLLNSKDVNVDMVDNQGISPLWDALLSGQQETLGEILVGKGADVGAFDRKGNSLLHNAIIQNLLDGAIYLLRKAAPIDDINLDHQSCLELCIMNNKPSVIKELCTARGVNPNASIGIRLPLEVAFEHKHPDACQMLVDCGADVNIKVKDESLLSYMISKRDEFAAVFLIKAGAKVNSSGSTSQSPLHAASAAGLQGIVRALLSQGADPNWQNAKGQTALHVAIINNQVSVVEMLLGSKNINTTLVDNEKKSVFRLAFELGNFPIASLLAKASPQFSTEKDENGLTMLSAAVGKDEGKKDGGDEEKVKFLLDLKVKITPTGLHDETALHLAVRLGRIKLCTMLLEHDSSCVNLRNNLGQTALHFSAANRDLNMATLLIRYGAGPVQDNDGNTALHLALKSKEKKKKQNTEVAKLLINLAPTFAKMKNILGETALHNLCANGGDSQLVDILVDNGIDVNQKDQEGNTPLLTAYLNGNAEIAVALMKRGADICQTNNERICILDEVLEEMNQLYPGRLALQRRLLDMIPSEPAWLDSTHCQFCLVKFNVTIRKHHCRHCGRIGCSTCLPKTRNFPIQKFGLTKPERVCIACYGYLTNPVAIVKT